ncbi:FMN-binding protein [Alkaliphilus sp. B6464]|uniref:FMN-binding protein n=1 Tax=Alkaliphilus sp. B6464 TaxID=2731219 RepID=UPI001BA8B022|nr:FMN-binding protein [Alkaliphilus sp. B6464]QUH21023.1 FMN-binding protein [Alkaliphilus sp. B6464]
MAEHMETPLLTDSALELIHGEVIKDHTLAFDSVSGATIAINIIRKLLETALFRPAVM